MNIHITFKQGFDAAMDKMDKAYAHIKNLHTAPDIINRDCKPVREAFEDLIYESKMVFATKEAHYFADKNLKDMEQHHLASNPDETDPLHYHLKKLVASADTTGD